MTVTMRMKLSPIQAGKLYQKSLRQEEEIKALKSLIKEASDYLDTNELTTICSSSILHQKFKEAITGRAESMTY